MAGSRTWRTYTDDAGVNYSISVDKSNANAIVTGGSAGQNLALVRTANHPPLPRGLQPRYLLAYNQANPSERRRFKIGNSTVITNVIAVGSTLTAEDYPGANDTPGSNVTWVITFYSGERRKQVPAFASPDTGEDDGVVTQ